MMVNVFVIAEHGTKIHITYGVQLSLHYLGKLVDIPCTQGLDGFLLWVNAFSDVFVKGYARTETEPVFRPGTRSHIYVTSRWKGHNVVPPEVFLISCCKISASFSTRFMLETRTRKWVRISPAWFVRTSAKYASRKKKMTSTFLLLYSSQRSRSMSAALLCELARKCTVLSFRPLDTSLRSNIFPAARLRLTEASEKLTTDYVSTYSLFISPK